VSRRNLVGGFFGLIGLGVGIASFAIFHNAGSGFSFHGTLPEMVSDFGKGARVVEILASTDDVKYAVIGRDGRLHERNYNLKFSKAIGGGTAKDRKIENSVRKATAAERANARVRLGDLNASVIDDLFKKVGFPHDGSSATLTGTTWLLQSGAHPFDKYVARYDGTGVHQTQSQADVFGQSGAPPQPQSQSGSAPPVNKLIGCIQDAHGDVTKITACQQRFGP
jgi:hypothetical protein